MKFLRYRGVCIECKSVCAANGGKRYFAVSRHFLCGEPRPEGGIPEGLSLGAKPPELFPAGKRRADKSQRREAKQAGFSQHSRANTRARRQHSCLYRASPYRRPVWRTGRHLPRRAPRRKFSIRAVAVSPLAKLQNPQDSARALTNPANAKIALINEKPVAIFAFCVSCACSLRSLASV